MENTKQDNKLLHMVIRVPKKESAFTYFTLESNEGLCFYSTLQESMGQGHRDIDITAHITFKEDVEALLKNLEKSIQIEYLLSEIIEDKS